MLDWDRAVVGWAVSFGVPVQGSTSGAAYAWDLDSWREWLRLKMACPLRVSHGIVVTSSRVLLTVGMVRLWAPAPARGETGLLVAAEVDPGPVGDGLLDAARRGIGPQAAQRVGLSVGAKQVVDPFGKVLRVVPEEVSLTYEPADPGAWVLAVGPGAVGTWDQLVPRRAVVSA